MKIVEGKQENDNFMFNGWFRWVFGIIITGVCAINAYAYYVVFPTTVENIVENDKASRDRDQYIERKVNENTIAIAKIIELAVKIEGLSNDLEEFKQILKRTAPYERK